MGDKAGLVRYGKKLSAETWGACFAAFFWLIMGLLFARFVEYLVPITTVALGLSMRDALNLKNGASVNPSGGALAANPVMAAGLIRIGEAAARITNGSADRALAHATSGPCLQQNLVCVLEGE